MHVYNVYIQVIEKKSPIYVYKTGGQQHPPHMQKTMETWAYFVLLSACREIWRFGHICTVVTKVLREGLGPTKMRNSPSVSVNKISRVKIAPGLGGVM